MPQDIHCRITAVLHIVMGTFFLLMLAVIGLLVAAFGALGPSYGVNRDLAAMVGGVGMISVGLCALLSVGEIVGAVLLLRGSPKGRAIVLGFSVLSLLNVPIGTAAGIYSLWALLRETPQPLPSAITAAGHHESGD